MPRRAEAFTILQRAIDRGQLAPDIDKNMLLDTLYGSLYFRFSSDTVPSPQPISTMSATPSCAASFSSPRAAKR